eukprot:2182459-Rhodomonas_salina.3
MHTHIAYAATSAGNPGRARCYRMFVRAYRTVIQCGCTDIGYDPTSVSALCLKCPGCGPAAMLLPAFPPGWTELGNPPQAIPLSSYDQSHIILRASSYPPSANPYHLMILPLSSYKLAPCAVPRPVLHVVECHVMQ